MTSEPSTNPVAPRMSAVREAPETRSKAKRAERQEAGDYSGWLHFIWGSAVAVFVMAFFFYAWSNFTRPKMVEVPNLKGKDLGDARNSVKSFQLQLKEAGRQTDEQVPAQTILRTDPEAGEKVKEGSVISVWVSSGKSNVEVPDLTGMQVDSVKTVLRNLDLVLDPSRERVGSATVPRDDVVDQTPKPHDMVQKGATVKIRLSTGEPDVTPSVPVGTSDQTQPNPPAPPKTDDRRNVYSLKIKLTDAITSILVRVDIEDAHGVRTVYTQQHDVNDVVEFSTAGYGPSVTFRIYYDGELKKTIREPASGGATR